MPKSPAHDRCFASRSPEATEALGSALGALLVDGTVLALVGEMGSGKTTFVRGLARGLAVDEPVTSPTFTLMQEYEGRLDLWHFDAWMAAREEAFLEAGGADVLGGDGVAVVEWAENVAAWLPTPRLLLRLGPLPSDAQEREVGAPERSSTAAEPSAERRLCLSVVSGPPGRERLQQALEGAVEALWRASTGLPGLARLRRTSSPPAEAP